MAPKNTSTYLHEAIRQSGKRTLRRLYIAVAAMLAFWTLVIVLVR